MRFFDLFSHLLDIRHGLSKSDRMVSSQGKSAAATRLCDIGNGTMNIMYINNCRPVLGKYFTEKYGTHQCMLAVREAVMREHQVAIDDATIEAIMRFGKADIDEKYLTTILAAAGKYVDGIMRRLKEHEYNPSLMRLYIVGGGGCLVKNFWKSATIVKIFASKANPARQPCLTPWRT